MRKSHALLLQLYHDPRYEFAQVRVDYVDRGAPQDASAVDGKSIARLDSRYMEIRTERGITCIPYHRILRIRYGDETLWERYAQREQTEDEIHD
ncbi:MAG: DUF504 domain-containing protein [Methanomicrobiales archaeon]|nr:DUF504 domain-containing protein [Methanomicrobiales archaeon]MDI6875795.1 DUF504 domain-containing protein [Methanomicrobiales archaeon]